MVRDHSPGLGRLPSLYPAREMMTRMSWGWGGESHFLWAVLGMLRALGKDIDIGDDQPERLERLAIPGEGIPCLTGCGNQDKGGAAEPALGA